MACITDLDCPGTTICYNTTWTNFTAKCACSTWFGFDGPDCLTVGKTSTSVFRITTTSILLTLWWLTFLVGTFDFIRLLRFGDRKWTVTHTCQLQLIIACVFLGLGEIFGMHTNLHAEELVIFLPGTPYKTTHLFFPKQMLTTFGYSCIFLALSTLPLHWREIAHQAFRGKQAKRKLSYVKPLIAFELSFATVEIVLTALTMPSAAYIAAIPFVVIVIISYGIGGTALIRVLTSVAQTQANDSMQKTRFLKSARSVAGTSIRMFVVGAIVLIMNLVFALVSFDTVWRELCQPGVLAQPIVIGFLSSLSLVSALWLGQYYISTSIQSTLSHHHNSNSRDNTGHASNPVVGPGTGGAAAGQRISPQSVSNDTPSSVQPDSIVGYESVREIQKKKKKLQKQKEPRLRAITDMSAEMTSNNPTVMYPPDIPSTVGGKGSSILSTNSGTLPSGSL
jgi:hypothetical protein